MTHLLEWRLRASVCSVVYPFFSSVRPTLLVTAHAWLSKEGVCRGAGRRDDFVRVYGQTSSLQRNDFVVSWQAGAGHTNAVQAGDEWNTATNISPGIFITGDGDAITNDVDRGAATRWPARVYRVRLVP